MNIELKKGANMEAKHTKGPWHIKENYDNMINEEKPGRHTIKSANGWNIARIWGNVGDGTSTANARLIAAAPELLEALRRVEGFMADMAKDIDGGNYPVSFLSVHNAVVSAIAKAEGRE